MRDKLYQASGLIADLIAAGLVLGIVKLMEAAKAMQGTDEQELIREKHYIDNGIRRIEYMLKDHADGIC